MRGAGVPLMLHRGLPNPALAAHDEAVAANRKMLLEGTARLLAKLPRPTFFPATFAGCRVCGEVRGFADACGCLSPVRPN